MGRFQYFFIGSIPTFEIILIWEQIEDYAAAVDCLAGEEVKAAYLHGAADFARVMARTESSMTG